MQRFEGKTAIVTGAGSGIGRATAVRLAEEGAAVVAVDVVQERLDNLAEQLGGRKLQTLQADLGSEEPVARILEAAGGSADVLINVAGIMDEFLPAGEIDDATWERVMAVNVTAMLRLTRAVLPGMIEKAHGSIVNVSSYAGFRGATAGVAYTASKHAVIGLTKNTAFMYAPKGIRANSVAPGPVETNIDTTIGSQYAYDLIMPIWEHIMPSYAKPETLASSICWLASDDAENVTGVVLPSDGGWAAK